MPYSNSSYNRLLQVHYVCMDKKLVAYSRASETFYSKSPCICHALSVRYAKQQLINPFRFLPNDFLNQVAS